jgi:hypothetical protein
VAFCFQRHKRSAAITASAKACGNYLVFKRAGDLVSTEDNAGRECFRADELE